MQPRTLCEAALLLGGERKLAEFLDIEVWLVSRWLEGLGQPPDFVFSSCVDLIESSKQAATVADERDKGAQAPIDKDHRVKLDPST